ncbi:MAG: hypothetical protein KAS32_27230 [Candidatus Peribacteraceae bacterium]|nr:hypothetical protein [Candidatus Peribacteraceae bacterium]
MNETPQIKAERLTRLMPYIDPDDIRTARRVLEMLLSGEDVDTKAEQLRVVEIDY